MFTHARRYPRNATADARDRPCHTQTHALTCHLSRTSYGRARSNCTQLDPTATTLDKKRMRSLP